MKHTKGPWSHDDGHIFKEGKREYPSIARVYDTYDEKGNPESNHGLIASAPELLETLQLFVSKYLHDEPIAHSEYIAAVQIIKKATEL